MVIYKITNTVNGKVYIGQTIQNLNARWRGHIKDSKKDKANNKFYNSLKKYGYDKFAIEVLKEAKNLEDLNNLEKFFILKYDSVKKGYNSNYGGLNSKTSEETKLKLRKANIGKKVSKSTRLKMKKAKQGKKPNITREGRLVLSKKMLGNKNPVHNRGFISNQTRLKMSSWQKGKNNHQAKRVLCVEENLVFDCIKDAAKWCKGQASNLGKVINGKYNDSNYYKGYTWIEVTKKN